MSVIIRLQNLPWSANSYDIRQFFHGLGIPEGGVHIVGGELGDAFIAFSTDEDARQAMMRSGGKLKEVQVALLLSSRSEMQKVIETARAASFPPVGVQMPQQVQPVLPNLMDNRMESKEDIDMDGIRRTGRSRSRSRDRLRGRRRRSRSRSRSRDRRRRRSRSRSRGRDKYGRDIEKRDDFKKDKDRGKETDFDRNSMGIHETTAHLGVLPILPMPNDPFGSIQMPPDSEDKLTIAMRKTLSALDQSATNEKPVIPPFGGSRDHERSPFNFENTFRPADHSNMAVPKDIAPEANVHHSFSAGSMAYGIGGNQAPVVDSNVLMHRGQMNPMWNNRPAFPPQMASFGMGVNMGMGMGMPGGMNMMMGNPAMNLNVPPNMPLNLPNISNNALNGMQSLDSDDRGGRGGDRRLKDEISMDESNSSDDFRPRFITGSQGDRGPPNTQIGPLSRFDQGERGPALNQNIPSNRFDQGERGPPPNLLGPTNRFDLGERGPPAHAGPPNLFDIGERGTGPPSRFNQGERGLLPNFSGQPGHFDQLKRGPPPSHSGPTSRFDHGDRGLPHGPGASNDRFNRDFPSFGGDSPSGRPSRFDRVTGEPNPRDNPSMEVPEDRRDSFSRSFASRDPREQDLGRGPHRDERPNFDRGPPRGGGRGRGSRFDDEPMHDRGSRFDDGPIHNRGSRFEDNPPQDRGSRFSDIPHDRGSRRDDFPPFRGEPRNGNFERDRPRRDEEPSFDRGPPREVGREPSNKSRPSRLPDKDSAGPEKDTDGRELCVELKGCPLTGYKEIRRAFSLFGCSIKEIKFKEGGGAGRRVGIMFMSWNSKMLAVKMSSNIEVLGKPVTISHLTDEEFNQFGTVNSSEINQEDVDTINKESYLRVTDVTSKTSTTDICKLFPDVKVLESHTVVAANNRNNNMFLKLASEADAKRALAILKKERFSVDTVQAKAFTDSKPVVKAKEEPKPPKESEPDSKPKPKPEPEPEPEPEKKPQKDVIETVKSGCILLKKLPFNVTDRDICDFFSDIGVVPSAIHIMLNDKGRPSGEAYIEFNDLHHAKQALSKNGAPCGRSNILISSVNREQMVAALEGPEEEPPKRPGPQDHPSSGPRGPAPLMAVNNPPPECVLTLENVPFRADNSEVLSFIGRGYGISTNDIFRKINDRGQTTGSVRVVMRNPEDALHAANDLNNKFMRGRTIKAGLLKNYTERPMGYL